MLFSEPKIPQCEGWCVDVAYWSKFQCSSASRKFLNSRRDQNDEVLQQVSVLFSEPKIPQSPTLLNSSINRCGFSALQRAENSSIPLVQCERRRVYAVSVLFSEPKIPQSYSSRPKLFCAKVSVLFSEPKIPQSYQIVMSNDLQK